MQAEQNRNYNIMIKNICGALVVIIMLSACSGSSVQQSQKTPSDISLDDLPDNLLLSAATYSDLPQWGREDFVDFARAYNRSCDPILKRPSQNLIGKNPRFGKAQEWQIACRRFADINQTNPTAIRQFFEQNFIPYQVANNNNTEGLFTGYYEAGLRGSRVKTGAYQIPLRLRPDDLVMVQLGDFRDELKGQRIAGRIVGGNLKPYETHAQIIDGQLPPAQDKSLVYVDSAVDAFFLQIQGSGVVTLTDGSTMRVGYAGQNGHPYYAIGKELIKRGHLTKENVSMQSIRAWLAANPSQAREIMTTNKSYVFFREITGEGPIGGQGVALTPMRSLAIDQSLIPYGAPIWLSAENPNPSAPTINRLMVTQDTGGAIRGPVRGDFFWGYGGNAEQMAGEMKSKGQYWILLPKKL